MQMVTDFNSVGSCGTADHIPVTDLELWSYGGASGAAATQGRRGVALRRRLAEGAQVL